MVKVVVKKGGKTYSYSYDYVTVKISQPTFFRLLEVKQKLEVRRRRQSLPGKVTMNEVINHLIGRLEAEMRREEEAERV